MKFQTNLNIQCRYVGMSVCRRILIKYENATALDEQRRVLHRQFCQFIEPVMFVRWVFIFALRNITLGGYLDTCRNI